MTAQPAEIFEGSDSSLVLNHLRKGGVTELTNLFEHHRTSLRNLIKRNLNGKLLARFDPSDIIQEAFIRAKERLDQYLESPKIHPNIWIRILCRQLLFEQTRSQLRACRTPFKEVGAVEGQPVVELLVDSTTSARTKLAVKEAQAELWQELANLPTLESEIIDMRHADCMTFREIGEILEMNTEAVKKRYYRALKSLRENAGEL